MNDISKKTCKLLTEFYVIAMNLHFGNVAGVSFKNALQYPTLEEFVAQKFSPEQRRVFCFKLDNYRKKISQHAKLQPLIDYLQSQKIDFIFDVGCGYGWGIHFIKKNLTGISNKTKIIAIDTLIDKIKISDSPNLLKTNSIKNLPKQNNIDVIIFIHSLHHMDYDEQFECLDWAKNNLKKSGVIYIVEDSWHEKTIAVNQIDKTFINLDDKQKKEIFYKNEYWANSWFNSSDADVENVFYRKGSEWEKLFLDIGFLNVQSQYYGFNFRRLHGVPQANYIITA